MKIEIRSFTYMYYIEFFIFFKSTHDQEHDNYMLNSEIFWYKKKKNAGACPARDI